MNTYPPMRELNMVYRIDNLISDLQTMRSNYGNLPIYYYTDGFWFQGVTADFYTGGHYAGEPKEPYCHIKGL
jgi:hypothetical protein